MKPLHLNLATILFSLLIFSCKKEDKIGSKSGKKGTFTIDNITYHGETSTQTFQPSLNYSILCSADLSNTEAITLQLTFHNIEEAKTGGDFTIMGFALNVPSGKVSVVIDGLVYDPDGSFTLNISNKKISMNNVKNKRIDMNDNLIKHTINSASIDF